MDTATFKENLARIRSTMLLLEIQEATISFAGGGDSGAIEDIYYSPQKPETNKVELIFVETVSTFDEESGTWSDQPIEKKLTLDDAITRIVEECLGRTRVNWWDDQGGQGEISIQPHKIDGHIDLNTAETVWSIDDESFGDWLEGTV